uniref:ShKT domain-containing protein n=1 Tax=Steinernema glaseri TaxID=37863 RepID=A0A1I7YVS3_9BILA
PAATTPATVVPGKPSDNGSSCVDTRDCKTYVKNGFCTNTWYTEEFRRKTCGKSCGLC